MATIHLTVFVASSFLALVICLPQQTGDNSGLRKSKAVFGSTYDEIVVETQLAVRPKALPSGGARRAKAVFFRPSSIIPNPNNGAEVRRVAPHDSAAMTSGGASANVTTSKTPTTPSDGLSYAALVVGVENPMARPKRVRRQWGWGGSPWSSFGQSPSFQSSQSGSQSFQFNPTGFSGSASQSYQLPTGDTISFSLSNGFGLGAEGPIASNALGFSVTDSNGKNKTSQFFEGPA